MVLSRRRSESEDASRPNGGPGARLFGFRRRKVAKKLRVATTEEPPVGVQTPATPLVVVACENCGFDYEVKKTVFADGSVGAIWECACGSRIIPPGGDNSFGLVRP